MTGQGIVPAVWAEGVTGKAATVGVLDDKAVAANADLRLAGSSDPAPCSGHATRTAGIDCGVEDGKGAVGMTWAVR